MTANKSYEYVEKYRYLNTTLTNQNYMHEEIKNRLNSLNSCYRSVQDHIFSFTI